MTSHVRWVGNWLRCQRWVREQFTLKSDVWTVLGRMDRILSGEKCEQRGKVRNHSMTWHVYLIVVHPPKSLMRWVPLIAPFCIWGNWIQWGWVPCPQTYCTKVVKPGSDTGCVTLKPSLLPYRVLCRGLGLIELESKLEFTEINKLVHL